jgi:diguanylate cyclase (GGDEF)-like protein
MINRDTSLILIVDDDLPNIEIMNAALENDYEIIFATNGKQAIEIAKKYQPDLILLDVMMPVMNGYKVCEYLKANPNTSSIPIIFVTALKDDMQAEIKGLQAGAIDYITKPINPPVVQMRVRNHIELQNARKKLRHLAVTDSLTDLSNRRHFDEILQSELNRLSRLHHPLSLIMLDVDFFKNFNDIYGHVVGDSCLKRVACTIKESLHRVADFPARYGGEEFACILPNTELIGAVAIAEQIRVNIENLKIPHQGSTISQYVTASLGVFTIAGYFKSMSEIIELADKQLYKAKENGRNQISFEELLKHDN